jgi:cysteine synthase A
MSGYTPDMCLEVHDRDALAVAFDLLEYEGLSLGGSSAIHVAGQTSTVRNSFQCQGLGWITAAACFTFE